MENNHAAQEVALFEYQGTVINHLNHGNSKKKTNAYVRTHPEVQEMVSHQLEGKVKPRDIYTEMLTNDDIHTCPRKVKQVHDMKYRKNFAAKGCQKGQTFADEIQQVVTMLSNPETVVQHIIHSKGKVPSVILYSEQTIAMLKSNCFRETRPSVLGIDRTFNLSKLYVTVTSFKNTSVTAEKGEVLFLLDRSCFMEIFY